MSIRFNMSWIFQELDCQQSTKQAKHASEWRDDQNQFGKTGASNGSRDLAPSRGFIYHLDHPLGTSQMCFYWIGIAPFCTVHLFWMLSIAWEKPDYSFAVRNCRSLWNRRLSNESYHSKLMIRRYSDLIHDWLKLQKGTNQRHFQDGCKLKVTNMEFLSVACC